MPSNPDNSPVSCELREVFHLESTSRWIKREAPTSPPADGEGEEAKLFGSALDCATVGDGVTRLERFAGVASC